MNSIALLSAEYAVHEAQWNPSTRSEHAIAIRVLHHPRHTFNVERMVRAIRASLDYYSEQFGPYPYRQFSMVESPRYSGNFGRASPGQMVYTEGNPVALARIEDEETSGIDTPLLMIAHELAHQWWGHQVMGADVQGSQLRRLSHSVARLTKSCAPLSIGFEHSDSNASDARR